MHIKSKYLILTGLMLLFVSCDKDTNISTYAVSLGTFSNSLMIEGFVEPVQSTTLSSPMPCDGTIKFLVEDGEYVEEGQVVCIIEWQEMQNQYDQLILSLENAEVGINKTVADLNMQRAILEAQVLTNDADTRIAQMDSLQIAFMSQNQRLIKKLELEKATIEKERYEKKLAALKVIQQTDVKKMELEITRFKTNVQSVKERLDALTIKAPRSGLLLRANNRLTGTKIVVGDPVWSNFPVATMPEFKQMKVMIMASETDYKSINVNDSVFYTFDAIPGNTGMGKILKKAPMGQPYKRGSTVKFFEIEASIDSVDVMPDPGFTANCKIMFKQVENVLFVPQIAIFEEDSMKVVFVQRKNGYEQRQVLTDVSSLKESVVTAGLNEGDVITLSKPKKSLIKVQTALPDSLTIKPESSIDTLPPANMQVLPPGTVPNIPQRMVQP